MTPGSQSLRLPVTLLGLALLVVGLGGAILVRFGGTIYPIAYAAALLAAIFLPLLLIGGWRREAAGSSRLLLRCSMERWALFSVFVFFLAVYSITRAGATPFYEPAVQAVAFLHGHSWVDAPEYMEQVSVQCNKKLPVAQSLPGCDFSGLKDRALLVHPPLSAILMMPVVALHGGGVAGADQYQPSVAAVLGALEVALAWRLLLLLGLSTSARLWLTAFFGLGTTLWHEATLGASWNFVLVVSVLPTLLTLNEVFGKARPWAVGLLAALGALGRYDLVMAWPTYALLLMVRGRRFRELFWMAPGFALAGFAYGIFNYTRFGTFFDPWLWLWYRCCDGGGYESHKGIPGPFSLRFLPTNLYTLLFLGWGFNHAAFPWVRAQGAGQALLLTSPAFVLTLRASLKEKVPALIWLASILTMSASLMVYASGFMQFGTRYYVQIFPFLLVLLALGSGTARPLDQLGKILIVASISIVAFGIWQIRVFGFG